MARIEVTADQVEVAPCLLCGGDDCRIVWDARLYGYARCNACGLYYQRPRVLESVMLALYGQSRDQASRRHAELVFDPKAPRAQSILSDYRRTLERAMAHTSGRKLLEVGFGRGELLYAAREAGLEACGTELGEDHCALVRERLGVDTRAGDFLTMDFPEAPFDLVVIRHVLEHLYRPHQACERLHTLLAQGGILLVEVPNLNGLEYRMRRLFSAIGIGRPIWERMNIPQHVACYAPDTMARLLTENGFELLLWETYSHAKRHSQLTLPLQRIRHVFKLGNKMRFLARRHR